jgi:hypothetical protein
LSPEIFVSYSADDIAVADKLCRALAARGFVCWMDRDLAWHSPDCPDEQILQKIASSCLIVVLLPAKHGVSPSMQREIAHAARQGIRIIPLRLSDDNAPSELGLYLDGRQYLDLFPDQMETHVDRLADALDRLGVPRFEPTQAILVAHRTQWRGQVSPEANVTLPTPASSDRVTFGAFAPTTVAPRQSFVVDVWAHTAAQSEAVAEQASALGRGRKVGTKNDVSVARGTVLSVVLEIPTMRIPDPTDNLVWCGEPSNASFIVEVPPDTTYGSHPGRAIIIASGIPMTKLIFALTVAEQSPLSRPTPVLSTECAPKTAFASYSSRDRAEVLARVQGMQKVRPDLEIFVDVITLRAGQNWEEEIRRRVRADDVFFLFWSEYAASSKEVEKEWRLALEARGLDYIDPVPLSDPSEVKPPQELKALHFNDYYLAYIKLSRQRGQTRKRPLWKFW